MYIKICKNCSKKHNFDDCSDLCECGASLITVAPVEDNSVDETKRYKKCDVCGTKNYIVNGVDVRVCSKCGSDNLYRYPVIIESTTKEEHNDKQTIAKSYEEREAIKHKSDEPRRYKECGVCHTRNYVISGKEPRICSKCGSDNLYRYPILIEGNENVVQKEEPIIQEKPKIVEYTEKRVKESTPPPKEESIKRNTIEENRLILISRDGHSVKLYVHNGAIIGRLGNVSPEYFLTYPSVGRTHCEFKYENGKWFVRNIKAASGTLINGKLINVARGEERFFNELKHGDVISFSNAHFDVRVER